jgi:hypothetical protein
LGGPITAVTYGGVAMAKAVEAVNGSVSSIYYLANPPTGANTILITFTGGSYGVAGAVSVTGADTTNPVDATATNTATGTSISANIATHYRSFLIDALVGNNSNSGGAANSGQTSRWNTQTSNTQTNTGSTSQTAAAGSRSMGWSGFGTSNVFSYSIIAIKSKFP